MEKPGIGSAGGNLRRGNSFKARLCALRWVATCAIFCLAGGLLAAAEAKNPLPAPADPKTNAINKTSSSPVVVVAPQDEKDQESFFEWLLGLGADSNRVFLIRQNKEVKKLFEWFADHGPGPDKVEHLLNGRDLSGFYTWLEKDGVFWDRRGVFTLTNGILRISGQERGYLATKRIYSDYRLVAEFKWGAATWGARKDRTRNSGLCIHGVGLDKVWMKSIEVQIAEGQTGDVVVLDGAKLTADGVTKVRSYDTFKRPGGSILEDKLGFRAKDDLEKPHGEWNTIEIISQGSILKVKINDKVVLNAIGAWPNAGRILLQSNGAEIFFRRLDVHSLK
jgi:hypothetical protein